MNKYINILIHNKRIEKGWSLESLSHGICSVSYLSKLEKGTIDSTEDITNKLLEKLDIHLETDLSELLPKVDEFYHSFILFFIDDSNYLSHEEIAKLLNSEYILDGLLIDAWQNPDTDKCKALQEYLPFYSYDQKKKYDQILVYHDLLDYHELLHSFPDIDSYSIIANSLYHKGQYAKSIPYYIQYDDIASRECNINHMIAAKMGLGSVYACLLDIDTCLEYYTKALKLIQSSNNLSLQDYIYYNIAATYVELEQYDLALEYLSKTSIRNIMFYHKEAICYEKTGNISASRESISKGYALNSEFDIFLDIVKYRLDHEDYIHDSNYGSLLLQVISKIEECFPSGFLYLQETELLKYYEANRKYKDAYELLKKRDQKF